MPVKAVIYRLAEEHYIDSIDKYIENYDFIKKVLQEIKIFGKRVDELYGMENNYVFPYSSIYQDMERAFSAGNATRENIHEEVYRELDDDARAFVNTYKGKNVTIVYEDDLYGTDPRYTTIFNNIAKHELVKYERGRSKNRGEVFSLAYAAYHNMNYFCSKEIMVDNVGRELEDLKSVDIITFDIILLQAYVYYARRNDNSKSKGLKAFYKKYCADDIKRHGLPTTLGEYIKASKDYL